MRRRRQLQEMRRRRQLQETDEEEEDNLVGATALTCSKSKLRLLKGKTLVHLYIVRMKVDLCLICALRWDVI